MQTKTQKKVHWVSAFVQVTTLGHSKTFLNDVYDCI